MSIEIDILNGDASWPLAKPVFDDVWPPEVVARLPFAGIAFAHPEWRVLVQDETEGVVCHVGIYRRDVIWNGRQFLAGGVGGVATRRGFQRRGYGSIALNAAIQTLKDEGTVAFGLLFCEPHNAPFYTARGWQPFKGDIFCEQPQGRVRFDAMAPYVFHIKRAPPSGTIDLCGLPW